MQASARVVEKLDVPTTGAATVGAGRPDAPPRRHRRRGPIPQRAIEIVGIVIGIGLVAGVARGHDLSNDEFWSLAAGQWMLAHHAFMGLDPFSYTESHRRWVTDEWGSEIALATCSAPSGTWPTASTPSSSAGSVSSPRPPTPAPWGRGAAGSSPSSSCSPLGIAGVVAGDRGLDFSLVWLPLELLLLTKARANPRWLLSFPCSASSGSTPTAPSCWGSSCWPSSWAGR